MYKSKQRMKKKKNTREEKTETKAIIFFSFKYIFLNRLDFAVVPSFCTRDIRNEVFDEK